MEDQLTLGELPRTFKSFNQRFALAAESWAPPATSTLTDHGPSASGHTNDFINSARSPQLGEVSVWS